MQKFKKRNKPVLAIQLPGEIRYEKWGGPQVGKKGDWLLNNDGDIYTCDAESFAKTYEPRGYGLYQKTGFIYAKVASAPGWVRTKEGKSYYNKGDYVVANDESGLDSYCISREKFGRMYEPA